MNPASIVYACFLCLMLIIDTRLNEIDEESLAEDASRDVSNRTNLNSGQDPVGALRGSRKFSWGVQTAAQWNKCRVVWKRKEHWIDTIVSIKDNLLFIDNVKAGSSSLRAALSQVLGLTWDDTDMPGIKLDARAKELWPRGRTTSSLFNFHVIEKEGLFRFSIVRDPVEKFESGVRQAWSQNEKWAEMTADEMLDLQLKNEHMDPADWSELTGPFINEHLQPSSWRLSAFFGKRPLKLDFIGKLETLDQDWAEIVRHINNVNVSVDGINLGKANTHSQEHRSRLSPSGHKKMCASEMYGSEWDCFGYPKPKECRK